ncbi:PAS domain S-box protein [Candidatus Accumulibacter phosphatis]|nr:PAS domain S-box protein [Candidatus Accumulibacter phosphatis]
MKVDVSNGLVIAIGASAGGLQGLRAILGELDPHCPYLFIIAHHLSPNQPSRLAEILAETSPLPVTYAQDGDTTQGDRILICPPGSDILVEQDRIVLRSPLPEASIAPSVDRLFTSLAQSAGNKALGIVLSGSGQDGLLGAREIAAQGGIVFAQSPDQAVHPSMPEAIIQADLADRTGDTQQIAQWLNQLDQLIFEKPVGDRQSEQLFAEIFRRVAELTDLDLSQYKEPTLRRQVIRRYRNLNIASLGEYLERVRTDDSEVQALYQSFMISVTGFFRDPEVYSVLSDTLHASLAKRHDGDSFRVWVPGCASGQEAYSLAILIAEILRSRHVNLDIRIFATDLDQRALERARAGIYSKEDLAQLDPVRRERWFAPCTGGWRVTKPIRDMVVFSAHDLTTNPPFIRMDLISCRNLLIYLKADQQAELIRAFHYGLVQDGILVLGRSESVGFGSNLFIPVDTDARIFRRNSATAVYQARQVRFRNSRTGQIANLPRSQANPHRQTQIDQAVSALATHYAPPAVLVNGNFEPVRFFGGAQRYFSLAEDNPEFTVFSLCLPALRFELKALCYRLVQEDAKHLQGGLIQLGESGLPGQVRPILRRVDAQEQDSEISLLICFEASNEEVAHLGDDDDQTPVARNEVDLLRRELADTREHLQAVIEELETSNEELQSLNEEVQSSSEELQASNEELQSSNEELTTLNDELRVKSQETIELNTTLANIQNSLRSSLVVVDRNGRIARLNNLASRIFGIVPGDIGQSLFGVPCHLQLPDLRDRFEQVIAQETSFKERVHQGEFHYLMQIDPYRNEANDVAGAVLTFAEISELHRAEKANLILERRFRQVWESSLEGMAVVEQSGHIVMANPALCTMFGYTVDALLGQPIEMLVPRGDRATHEGQRDSFFAAPTARRMARMRDVCGLHRSGREFFVEVSLSGMTLEGEQFVLAVVSDISARKAAELALRRSDEDLRLALSAAKAGVWRWELATNKNTWSNNLWDLYGINDRSIPASYDAWLSRVLPAQRESITRTIADATASRVAFDVEWQVNGPTGAPVRWLFARGIPVQDNDGEVTSYQGIVIDISERKASIQALHQSKDQLRLALSTAKAGVWNWDIASNANTWSDNLHALYGITDQTIAPSYDAWLNSISSEYRSSVSGAVIDAAQRGATFEIEWQVNTREGVEPRWLLARGIPTLDDQGKPTQYNGIVLDITARRVLEERLLEWANAFQHVEFGMALGDAKRGCLIAVNPAFARRRGFEPEEMAGTPVLELFPPDLHDQVKQQIAKMDRDGHLVFESEHVTRNGERFPVMIDITVTKSPDGTPRIRIGLVIDISERKAAERELAQYRQHLEELVEARTQELAEAKIAAESATVAKSAFLANMSHEIRTPLNAIMGISHLIRNSGLSDEQDKRFEKLQASADHLLDVINSILDLSKIEANKLELEEAPVSVDRLVSSCVAMLLERAQAKHVALLTDVGAMPSGLQGDATRLQQALLNYATNAVRFTDRGCVTLRVQTEAVTEHDATLRFSVIDTGIGIDPDALKRLFAAFEQADNTMTRKYGGTGLGLAITKRLAILMGGEAGAESVPGKGSRFWFTVRLRRVATVATKQLPASENVTEATLRLHFGGSRILLAEDEIINQEVVSTILQEAGFTVDIAANGAEAVRMASEGTYALILMDMQMPVLNGVDATRQIRQQVSGRTVPIIALTANAFSEDRLRCQEAGMNDFVTKPLAPATLFGVLHHWLSKG